MSSGVASRTVAELQSLGIFWWLTSDMDLMPVLLCSEARGSGVQGAASDGGQVEPRPFGPAQRARAVHHGNALARLAGGAPLAITSTQSLCGEGLSR